MESLRRFAATEEQPELNVLAELKRAIPLNASQGKKFAGSANARDLSSHAMMGGMVDTEIANRTIDKKRSVPDLYYRS